jgi:hypothetical protein
MSRPVTENPDVLANIIHGLGGSVIPGPSFRFDLPLERVKEVVPKINDLGIRCRKVAERVGDHPTQINRQISIATIELYKSDEPTYDTPFR